MYAAIDWSYQLLDEGARRLFVRLAVFVGGCTLEAIETVIGEWESAIGYHGSDYSKLESPCSLLNRLASLVNNSLVLQQRQAHGEARFVLLEPIRAYALERLIASGEADDLRRRHAGYYMRLEEETAIAL